MFPLWLLLVISYYAGNFELIFVHSKKGLRFIILHMYPILLAPLIDESILSPLYPPCTSVKNSALCTWVNLWTPYFGLLDYALWFGCDVPPRSSHVDNTRMFGGEMIELQP